MPLHPFARLAPILATVALLPACSNTPTHKLPSGIQVTPITVEKTDVADVLDIKMYRFNVVLPESDKGLDCNLEVRRKGQKPDIIGGVGYGPSKDGPSKAGSYEVFVGLHPVDDSWGKSDQLKTQVRISSKTSSVGSSGTKSNPFKNYNIGYGSPQLQQDGSFLILVGAKNKSAMWPLGIEQGNDLALVVTFTPNNIPNIHRK